MSIQLEQYQLINTDSRSLKPGDIFLALRGENFNGHDFIDQALELGASLVYSEQAHQDPRVKLVKNSLEQYHLLANQYRNLINPIVIAITGSAGKTTAKELLASILKEKFRIHHTSANFNNEIGVPKTILSMPTNTEVLILEMGMRGLGEIELLSKTAEPNIALITNIGTAHIERLGSRDNIKKAKLEIIAGLKEQGLLILDQKLAKETKTKFEQMSFEVEELEILREVNYLVSEGLLASIAACRKIATRLGLSKEQINTGLKKFNPGKGRGEFIYDGDNIFIDETYNSNPEAVRNSIRALLKRFPNENKIALLGDIKESQAQLVDEVFSEIKELENDKFKLLDARNLTSQEARNLLEADIQSGRNIILVKASRSAKFENCIRLDD